MELAATRCLSCGQLLDAASAIERPMTPTPGDVSVCLYCGGLAMFNEQLGLRKLTEAEYAEVSRDPQVISFQEAVGELGVRKDH